MVGAIASEAHHLDRADHPDHLPVGPARLVRSGWRRLFIPPRVTVLSSILAPMPIYEGLLAVATATERQIIVAAGPRELLDNNRMFGSDPDYRAAIAAYDAMTGILTRITSATELCITGIDPRAMPPRREPLDPAIVLHGILLWEGPEGCMSKLLLAFLHPVIHIADLRIEPTERRAAALLPVMSPPTRFSPTERIDDDTRLRRMQEHIDEGVRPKSAARRVAAEMPNPPTSEDSVAARLVRKFKQRQEE
jgi:hypothetical protein